MNPLDRLSDYLGAVEKRLRLLAWTRGAAIAAGVALVATVALVLIANSFAFSSSSLTASRTLLFLALALAIGSGLLIPLLRLNRRRAARKAEERFPEFEQRLLTLTEKAEGKTTDPFLELLAADALEAARNAEPEQVASRNTILGFASVAAVAVTILIWLGMAGPGFWGYGTSLLWAGPPKNTNQLAFYDIVVEPGDKTLRKKSDQIVTARMVGFTAQSAKLFAKFGSVAKWEEASMRPQPDSPNWEFLFTGVPETLEYYVEAGGVRSKTFKLNVVDLPSVKKIKVTYKYPAWSGMKDSVEDPGGDLRAVEGTTAELVIETDRPLASGVIVVDGETRIPIENGMAKVPIKKDGMYHVASVEKSVEAIGRSEDVRLTDDYFIEARQDSAPNVRIRRPGRDAKANPIEEVPVLVEADDDFGLTELALKYSVNGGPEKSVAFQAKGQKTAEGQSVLALEDFKLAPGDIVAMYATAKDARATAQTDMFFIEAQPFEREYSQSQQMGGGGGGGGDEGGQNEISRRQKEIIAATWNQIRDKKQSKDLAAETAKFLADMQGKLRDQAKSLAQRMKARDLAGTNQEFQQFVKAMETAAAEMGPASEKLKGMAWQDALGPEQRALQHLLRAESVFRQIQVAFGQRGGGGGGGGGGAGRDLDSLFDLELDTEKNQYESAQQAGGGGGGGDRQKEIDEAMQKLEQLAKRQQELAEQQRRNAQTSQQRYQQEMLRREAEQLRRQMEQLSRQQSGQQSAQGQQGQQSNQSGGQSQQAQGGQQGQQQQGGQAGQGQMSQQQMQRQLQQMRQQMGRQQSQAGQQQLERAIEQLKQAEKAMQAAASSQSAGTPQSAAEARRAAEGLRQAEDLLSQMRKQEGGNQLSELARKSEQLAEEERQFGERLRQAMPTQPGAQRGAPGAQAQQLSRESEEMRRKLRELESQMQSAARELASLDQNASSKIRQAVSELQDNDIDRNLANMSAAIRLGYGSVAGARQQLAQQTLDHIRDRMKELEAAGIKGGKQGDQGLQQALEQAESLRRQMEQVARSLGQRGQGQQAGQEGQRGQQGQGRQQDQQGQQGGQQAGQQGQQAGQQGQQGQGQQGQGQQGQNGQQGGQQAGNGQFGPGQRQFGGGRAGAVGSGGPGGWDGRNNGERWEGPYRSMNPAEVERAFRETVRDLGRMRENLGETPEIAGDALDLMREMQRINPQRLAEDPTLASRINSVLGGLEQIELQLRRKIEEAQGGGNVRSAAGERAPAGYARSVEEYFRRLAKDK